MAQPRINEEKYDLLSWQGRIKLKIFKLQKMYCRVGNKSTSDRKNRTKITEAKMLQQNVRAKT